MIRRTLKIVKLYECFTLKSTFLIHNYSKFNVYCQQVTDNSEEEEVLKGQHIGRKVWNWTGIFQISCRETKKNCPRGKWIILEPENNHFMINQKNLQLLLKLTEHNSFQRRKKMEEMGWQYICSHTLTKHLPHSIWGPPGIWVFYQTEQLQLFWEILNLPRRTSCHVLYWKTCEK